MGLGFQGCCVPIQDPGDQKGGSQALKLLSSLALADDGLRAASGLKLVQTNLAAGLKTAGKRDH